MSKLGSFIAIILLSINSLLGQNVIQLGDQEMAKENYAKAAYIYIQYFHPIESEKNLNSAYYPYGLHHSEQKKAKDKKIDFSPPEKITTKTANEVVHKLARAFRLAKDYKHAEEWYALASKNENESFPNATYYYGITLMENGKYKAAGFTFSDVLATLSDTHSDFYHDVSNRLKSCQYALRMKSMPSRGEQVHKLNEIINAGASSFGMMFTSKGLLFASTMKPLTSLRAKNDSSNYDCNLYLTDRIEGKEEFTTPTLFKGNANSYAIEGGAVLLFDGKTILFTREDPHNKKNAKIYLTRFFQGHWTPPFLLGDAFNVDGYKSMSPCLGKVTDEKVEVYYASNRPGGYGGFDIWKTTINRFGQTTPPKNLGQEINTFNDEITPFYDAHANTIYFSSKGHIGYGGFDIYKSAWNIVSDQWNIAKNMGNVINSSKDDAYFIWNSTKNSGYMSSDRDSCSSCSSTDAVQPNCFKIYAVTTPAPTVVTIKGKAFDMLSNKPLSGVLIEFKDIRGEQQNEMVITDKNGAFSYKVQSNMTYFAKASKITYFADAHIIKTSGINKNTTLTQDFYLQPVPTEEIEIPGIEYDLNSSYLRDKSKKILDSLINFLQLNENLVVQIRSHTDINGDSKYNAWLSQRRAQKVVDYLIEHGISKSRLSAKGYGDTVPKEISINGKKVVLDAKFINSLKTDEAKEKYNQMNRRTTFKVLKQ